MIILVAGETLLLGAGGVYLLVSLLVQPGSGATGVAIVVLALVVTVGLAAIVVGLVAGRRWARSGAVTWQVLQALLAAGCFQGLLAAPALGWALLLPALLTLVLAFTPTVVAATKR